MKIKKLLTLLATGVLTISLLVACSSNQKADKAKAKPKLEPIEKRTKLQPAKYGFMQVANDSTERLWFACGGEIAKDTKLSGVYAIKNGKVTYYCLDGLKVVNNGDSLYLDSEESLTFKDIENLSNSEIIKKAQKLDKKAYFAQAKLLNEYLTDYETKGPFYQSYYDDVIAPTADDEEIHDDEDIVVPGEEDDQNDSEEHLSQEERLAKTFNQVKSQIADFNSDKGYQKYRKQVTDQPLKATVTTDDSGNYVLSETIVLKSMFSIALCGYSFDSGFLVGRSNDGDDSISLDLVYSSELSIDSLGVTNTGTVLNSDYIGIEGIVTRDFPDGLITVDKMNTKNVVEEK